MPDLSISPEKVSVCCQWCDRRLKVKSTLLGRTAKCPHCGEATKLAEAASRGPADSPRTAKKPAPRRTPKRPPAARPPKAPVRQKAAVEAMPAESDDAWLDGLSDLPDTPAWVAPAAAKSARPFRIQDYIWQLLVGGSALLFLMLSVLPERSMLPIGLLEAVVGFALVGALFLPRYHLLGQSKSVDFSAIAGKSLGGGVLGVLGLVAVIGLRAYGRLKRNEQAGRIDLSGFDPQALVSIMLGFALLIGAVFLGFYLWRRIGIVRTLSMGYLVQITMMIAMAAVVTVAGDPDAERREAQAERARELHEQLNRPADPVRLFGRPAASNPTSPTAANATSSRRESIPRSRPDGRTPPRGSRSVGTPADPDGDSFFGD